MSDRDDERGRRARALAEATREAREDPAARDAGDRVDWEKVDRNLFARLDAEGPRAPSREDRRRNVLAWAAGGLAAAAAAVLAVVAAGDRSRVEEPNAPEIAAAATAGAPASRVLRGLGGAGLDVRANGKIVGAEFVPYGGDTLETGGTGAILVARGTVTWAMEPSSRLRVERAAAPLVITLDRGAVEAEVAPVDVGEAFAVDVGGVRVAVHGTHLRVENRGGRLILDLRAGVVVIGRAPKRGMTAGALVAAPAHVELDPADLDGTMVVQREPSSVRAALDLPLEPAPVSAAASAPPGILATPAVSATPGAPSARSPARPASVTASVDSGPQEGPPAALPAAPPSAAGAPPLSSALPRVPSPTALDALARPATPTLPPPRAPVAVRAPASATPGHALDAGVSGAVRACWFTHSGGAGPIVSTLTIDVGDDGGARSSRFEPPVPAEVAACAARAIAPTRFPAGGRITMTLDFSR